MEDVAIRNTANHSINVNTGSVRNVESGHITLFSDDETQDLRMNIMFPQDALNSENEFEEQPPLTKRPKKDNKGKSKNRKN